MIQLKNIRVAVDGPVAAGKSSVAKEVAKQLSLTYIDTGSMYRAVVFGAIKYGIDPNDEQELVKMIKEHKITLRNGRTLFDDEDVTDQIRTDKISLLTSKVASHGEVRELIVKQQQEMILDGGIIMDGRDIGTVVIPNAEVKIFLIASVESRAKRRYNDNLNRGLEADIEKIEKEIEQRDHQDMTRTVSPLRKADDAIEVDTSNLTFDESVQEIIKIIKSKI